MRRSKPIWLRFTSLILLAWFPLLAALPWLGAPGTLPARVGDAQAERYPCETHRCGCAGVATCWDACCCYSPLEMAAWALHAGVSLPAGMEEYAALVPSSVSSESDCCAVTGAPAPDAVPVAAPRVASSPGCGTFLAAPADPFACKGVALGLFFQIPVMVAAGSPLALPAPRVATHSATVIFARHAAPFLDRPDPPPRSSPC
ncbi:MAG: hypothetical protein HKN20_00845 [Gemmatimonadetes bacterium]|nr:hypothetical protein [Gemmatimonadota bacterium]